MYDKYFFPTYEKYLSEDFAIDSVYLDTDRDPAWGTPSFNKTVSGKIPMILNKLNQMEGDEYLLYSDVDVIFLKPIKDLLVEEMGDSDIVFSDDDGKICTGFIFMRNNDKVRIFFENIKKNYSLGGGDQMNTRSFARNHKVDIKYKLLSLKFFNIVMVSYLIKDRRTNKFLSKLFVKSVELFPDPIVMFHANYLLGIDEKEKWLEMVSKEFLRRNSNA
jgi:hypothetical protein